MGLSEDKKRKIKRKVRNKSPRMMLLMRTINRIMQKDEQYIQKVLMFGDDPDYDYIDITHNGNTDYGKIIYVIKENSNSEGFCATLRFIIGFLMFAKEHGFEPVIRLTKDFIYYDEEKSKEISNPWEYYFTFANREYDESKALHVCYSQYYHMMTLKQYDKLSAYEVENYSDEDLFKACSPVIKEYMGLRPEIVNEATEFLGRAKDGDGMIIGVHFRGTDYKKGYNKHPVFVGVEQTIEEIKKAIETQKVRAVFVATDDSTACDEIRKSIGDVEVLQYTDVYRSEGNVSVAFSKSDRKYHHYLLGYEILRDMYTLSLCDGLIAGKSSVSYLSNLYKRSRDEKYAYMHIIDNGNNVNDKNHIVGEE